MSVDTLGAVGTFPEPSILVALYSVQEKFADLPIRDRENT